MTSTRCARAGDMESTLVCFSFDITLMKLSSLTSSLIGHWYQFALSSHLESSTVWDFCSCFSYLYSNDTFGHSNSESVSLSRYLQTGVAALLMFTSNDMVYRLSFAGFVFVIFFLLLCYHCLLLFGGHSSHVFRFKWNCFVFVKLQTIRKVMFTRSISQKGQLVRSRSSKGIIWHTL